MAISGINNYRAAMSQWQAQQLKATGSSASSRSVSSALDTLSGGTPPVPSQVSNMADLTKYVMDQMGTAADSRVTFNQLTNYREQLQSEFNAAVQAAISESGIANLSGLSFELDKEGQLTALGDNAEDRKMAQTWLDANPSYGKSILENLPADAFENNQPVAFSISSAGKFTAKRTVQSIIQTALAQRSDIAHAARTRLRAANVEVEYPLELGFDAHGNLAATGKNPEAIHNWLAENEEIGDAVKQELAQQNVDPSTVSLRLDASNPVQITINDAHINDIQAGLDKAAETGRKISQSLGSLGINKNINFSLKTDENGAIKVLSNHPDAAKIQKLFNYNPELAKQYRQIETLAGIDDARKAMQISPSAMRKRIEIESMASQWASSPDSTSYFGNFSSDGMSLLAGINLKI